MTLACFWRELQYNLLKHVYKPMQRKPACIDMIQRSCCTCSPLKTYRLDDEGAPATRSLHASATRHYCCCFTWVPREEHGQQKKESSRALTSHRHHGIGHAYPQPLSQLYLGCVAEPGQTIVQVRFHGGLTQLPLTGTLEPRFLRHHCRIAAREPVSSSSERCTSLTVGSHFKTLPRASRMLQTLAHGTTADRPPMPFLVESRRVFCIEATHSTVKFPGKSLTPGAVGASSECCGRLVLRAVAIMPPAISLLIEASSGW